uniref:Uncharacterized protein n=1 Tax=Salmonella phage vB_STmST313_KE31 TaxID=3161181 RepID=A0AAU8GLX8_9CAUD
MISSCMPVCAPHHRRLFFQGFPLASLNHTGIRACKIGLDTTLMALVLKIPRHP